ncbi:protein Spindly isoform X1 [Zootoca vivipara]|uniref:protein Spindly isoform X1 n=1 Tax=Zootoca vivipara TaxID=8524 RepID=UPI0015914070|nr:protein Spindly isoform X1 [Zootoca vivipara]
MKMEPDKETISRLRRQLKEAEEERRKAAQYGLDLVESESLLQNQLDKLQSEIATITENFEQEKYTLLREVELKNRMLESMNLECETLKQHQNVQLETQREQLVRMHGQETNELKNKMEKLKSELDETLLSEKQLKHKVDHLKEVLASKTEELRMMSERVHETMSSEVLNLQLEVVAFEQAKADLEDRLHELQYSKEQLELGNSNLTNRLARLEEEREDREKDIVSYCNALEKAHEVNRDLQLQLDHARQEALDPSSKGNSLFAEVEDRRAEMERQLISMKVKYQLLQNQYSFTREQQQRLKLQMATLLRMKGSQGEHDQLERLQSMLQQKNGEIEELLMKVKQLEKPMPENSKALKLSSTSEYAESEDGYYTDLLQMKLENSEKEIENLKSELSLQRMKALFESQRVLEMERKLFAKERQLEASQSESINLRVLLDEMRIKYQPEELMRDSLNRKKAPGDVISYNLSSRGSSECETSCMLSQKKEETKLSEDATKTTLQAVLVNKDPLSAMEQRSDQPEKKKVKIKEEELDRTAINMKDKNEIGPSPSTRSVSSNMYEQGNQHRPASLFFRCMNYAIHFFIYFLSVACSVVPQFQLPSLKFSKLFKKIKITENQKDS